MKAPGREMLEYLTPAEPPTLCVLYSDELQRYYCNSNLSLFRAAIPHHHLEAANQGAFIVVRDYHLIYLTHQERRDVELPLRPVSIGLNDLAEVWLLDEVGNVWLYHPAMCKLTLLFTSVLSISPDAGAYVTREGEARVVRGRTVVTCPGRSIIVGTRNWGSMPSFCDEQWQWYMFEQLIPFARAERQVLHANGTMHYLREDGTLCWLQGGPNPNFLTLQPGVLKITGANGSVVAEGPGPEYHFYFASAKLPFTTS